MKLDFNVNLKGLNGEDLKDQKGNPTKLNSLVANSLVAVGGKENIMKFFDWGIKLENSGILDLDRTDQALFRSTIENSDVLYIIAKARVLEIIDARKEELTKSE